MIPLREAITAINMTELLWGLHSVGFVALFSQSQAEPNDKNKDSGRYLDNGQLSTEFNV